MFPKTAKWHIVLCILMRTRNVAAEECYVSYTDTGDGKLMCLNVKHSIIYNETLTNNVTQILLFRTQLSSINSNFFDRFDNSKIRILTMSHGFLSGVEDNSFKDLNELQHLNLSFNKIKKVSERAFVTNSKLRSISLMSNEIRQLKMNTFSILIDLEFIDLTRNYLDNLDKQLFLDNENLLNLDLKFNHIKEISGVMFHALPVLETLDLSYNQIEKIPPHIFKYNYALKNLNLRGNKIKVLDFALVHLGLSELNLLENPLDMSNEKNQNLIRHLKKSNLILKVTNHVDYEEDKHEIANNIPGEVVFKMSVKLQAILGGIITFLVIILVLLSFLLYHIHQRNKQKLYKRYYDDTHRSIENLQTDEQKCLSLNIAEGNAFFHNREVGTVHNGKEGCSCVSCVKNNTDDNTSV